MFLNTHFPKALKYWYEGKLYDWSASGFHPMMHALHYGTSVFEGIRAYRTAKGPAIFRLPEHNERFLVSAGAAKMKSPYTKDQIAEYIRLTVRANGLDSCYIRPLLFTAVLALSVPLYLAARAVRGPKPEPPSVPLYVGSEACRECHAKAYDGWKVSHHALAMLAPRPNAVLGDFRDTVFEENGKTWRFFTRGDKYFVRTDDLAGPPAEFEIAYTFGWTPLQQYIVLFPGGRLQCLSVAWDVPKRRWFSLYPGQNIPPGDWLHWTRPALNWNTMCSQCHSTGVRKRYDPGADTYSTTWAVISVGCEACHGTYQYRHSIYRRVDQGINFNKQPGRIRRFGFWQARGNRDGQLSGHSIRRFPFVWRIIVGSYCRGGFPGRHRLYQVDLYYAACLRKSHDNPEHNDQYPVEFPGGRLDRLSGFETAKNSSSR